MIKICIVTGTRAEYGIFFPLLKKLKTSIKFQLQIVATGMHLSPEFGLTYKKIEEDGFLIDDHVEMLLSSDSKTSISKSTGLALISFADVYRKLQPDMVFILGDRYELLAAASAAYFSQIPIAHIHGGETTEGAFDEGIRHSISKMSYLHFTTTADHRKRVIQLGEDPKRVYNVGALGIDNIKEFTLLSKEELSKDLNFTFGNCNALVTFHPVTLEENSSEKQFQNLLNALLKIDNFKIIFTKPNSDTYGRIIIKMIDEFVSTYPQKASAYTSLGQLRFLSAVNNVDMVIGNSSSGLIEVPTFGIPTINIGDRQKGRTSAESVIDVNNDEEAIVNAIKKARSKKFKEICKNVRNPYGDGDASLKIIDILSSYDFSSINLKKKFYDIDFNY